MKNCPQCPQGSSFPESFLMIRLAKKTVENKGGMLIIEALQFIRTEHML